MTRQCCWLLWYKLQRGQGRNERHLIAVTETVGTRNKLGATVGGLILFETRPNKTWEQRLRWDTLQLGDKTVELVDIE